MAIQIGRRLFTVDEYYRMGEAGILRPDDRVELIEGEVIEMVPIGSHHAGVVINLTSLLFHGTAPAEATISVQNPVRLSDLSEPVPDLAVLQPRSYTEAHPTPADVMLLIEVSDSTLLYDQRVKVPLYARSGIPEVWIVNLTNRSVEVHRERCRDGYDVRQVAERGNHVTPQALPHLTIAVDDILR